MLCSSCWKTEEVINISTETLLYMLRICKVELLGFLCLSWKYCNLQV
uniref:Uncharacterized protein n=1 Tax=Setaria viridis TaxID=4556 RepID=A0A4U6VCA5_SETVI|nr:hypothetical protein SEVIR_4G129601v2 [Setaria viridis]